MSQERTRLVQTGTQGRWLFVGIGVFVALGLAGWVAILVVEGTEVVDAPMPQTAPTSGEAGLAEGPLAPAAAGVPMEAPVPADTSVRTTPPADPSTPADPSAQAGAAVPALTPTPEESPAAEPVPPSPDLQRPTLTPEAVGPRGLSRKDLALLASVRAKHGDSLRNLPVMDPRTRFAVSFSGPPEVAEDDVKRVLSSHRPHVQICAAAQEERNEPVAGTIEVTFTVSPDGTIRSARTTGGTVDNLRFRHCVIFKIGRLTWPTKLSADLDVRVTYQVP